MQILLNRLELLNFKGIRHQAISFEGNQTTISGGNATGKTSIFDAFTWLLFGKDSRGATSFDIKTFDEGGNVIEHLPHEVEGILVVDGELLTLKRCYCEKWTRKRGADAEEFTGHETKYFVNGVEKSQSEYNGTIAGLCSEHLFRFITDPLFFPSQKKEVQRAMLFELAGNVADSDIINQRQEFIDLFALLSGKSLEEFKKEISAKKKKLKEVLDVAPIQLAEVERNLPASQDWDMLAEEGEDIRHEIAELDDQLGDQAKQVEAQQNSLAEVQRQVGEKKAERTALEFSLSEAAAKEYNEKKAQRTDAEDRVRQLRDKVARLNQDAQGLAERRTAQEKRVAEYRADWVAENVKELTFSDDEFTCPVCKRQLEVDDIEAKQEDMRRSFNEKKAKRLAEIQQAAAAFKKGLEEVAAEEKKNVAEFERTTAELKVAESDHILTQTLTAPAAVNLEENAEHVALTNAIAQLEAQLSVPLQGVEQSELKSKKQQLQAEVDELNRQLALKPEIEKGNKRIAELKEQIRANSQEMAQLEKQEFTLAAFSKAKVEAIESRINGMFELVRFKMFDTQVNGAEVETCEATNDGVPYSTTNKAMQVNMGIDIINTLCRKNGIYAPIFIDNAESVNEFIPTASQLVRLVVTKDKELTVTI